MVGEARTVGLDVERFRHDLSSDAIAEAFEADLEESRDYVRDAGLARDARLQPVPVLAGRLWELA